VATLRQKIAIAARIDMPVLLTGTTGTGTVCVGSAIHVASRPGHPLLTVDLAVCTEPTRELLDAAADGTMLLENVHLASPQWRQWLSGVVAGQGGRNVRSIRLIATAPPIGPHAPGSWADDDLYRSLSTFSIALPRLRDRIDDLGHLLDYYVDEAIALGLPRPETFSAEALHALRRHSWSGNLCELRLAVFRLVERAAGAVVGPDDVSRALGTSQESATSDAPRPLNEVIRQTITDALQRHHGNVTAAARALAISKVTLYRKLEELTEDPRVTLNQARR